MKWNIPIKYKLTLFINLLLVPVVVLLSILFYIQFRFALNERVLLQLTSIKHLKKVRIEDYLQRKWSALRDFDSHPLDSIYDNSIESDDRIATLFPGDKDHADPLINRLTIYAENGIYDLSNYSEDGQMLLGMLFRPDSSRTNILITRASKIQEILLERTGMGETGETYLVGEDHRLRSTSRFFPEKPPLQIYAPTEGVRNALNKVSGTGVFPDYRGVLVYSSYDPLEMLGLHWSILSEIDEEEALAPLLEMKQRLIFISLIIVAISIIASFQLALLLVKPVVRMKNLLSEMALGNYNVSVVKPPGGGEIEAMFDALDQLIHSINQAMQFANDIGNLRLDKEYVVLSQHDTLGKALINMRDKLKTFNEKEEQHQLETQKAILLGQENERTRLSKELHDGLGPLLTTLKLMIQQLDIPNHEKTKIKKLLDETITEVRRMTYNLMPQALIDFGVGQSLSNLVDILQKVSDINIKYVNSMKTDSKLPSEINIGLYRIAQEALNNALKHSKATEIRMSITEFDDRVSFYFKDNGRGFEMSKTSEGAGLLNMRERCRVLNGTFDISSDETGTTLEMEIPVNHD